ncbi:helix-turn-helix transcriptional regulator [Ciceribacter thiooxidans]|uniref:Helix-turn-helix transcriptional regulator n=1 Tax=Ciceribacter thiooxidans TaxID=1969821 RepID=A0ABV7I350_9HYPH|nr:helix-turn-helix transcriptional regulator [Ciceribacter thiooxidans]
MFYERQSLRDASEHDACDGEWVQSYRQVSRGTYGASFELMAVGDAVISRERIAPSVAQETRSPAGKLSFIFPITAQGGWRVNGHHEMGTMVALRQGETELMTVVGEESDLISLTLPVEAIGLSTGGSSVRSRTRSPADEALGDWLSCLLGFGALEGRPSADLERVLPDLLAERFLDFWAAFDEHSKRLTSRRASLDLFRRVERHIADDPGEPVTLPSLACHLGVPLERLRSAFLDAVGMPPSLWLRLARLDGARRELLDTRSSPGGVSEIAMRWGFFHLGRFSGMYRTHYGETPVETLKRLDRPCARPATLGSR